MSINKDILFKKVRDNLLEQRRRADFNMDIVLRFIEETIFNDPSSKDV